MGTWGTGITQSDEFMECYDEFFDAYKDGKDPAALASEIWDRYASEYPDDVSLEADTDIMQNVRFALARCLWQCGVHEHPLLTEVKNIIENDLNLKFWGSENGGNERLAAARKRELAKFWSKLQTEPARVRVPTKSRKPRTPSLGKGDIFAYHDPLGGYRAAIVLDIIEIEYLIAVSDSIYTAVPSLEEFLNDQASILFWIWQNEILPKKDRIPIGKIMITDSYNGYAGYAGYGRIINTNPGDRTFFFGSDFAKSRMQANNIGTYQIREILTPDRLPKSAQR